MSGSYSNGTTAAQAAANKKKKTGKKKSTGSAALIKHKMSEPGMKFVEWRAKSGERMSVTAAKIQEKFAHWGASMKLGLYTATHPVHPLRREAAKQAMLNKKAAATERKTQKISSAQSVAAAKRARAREARVAQLNQAVH